MSKRKKATPEKEAATPETESPSALAAAENEPEAGGPQEDAEETAAVTEVLPEDEIADLRNRLLRSMAETENLRVRAEREREEVARYAVTGFARDMLSVADNLRRAIENVTDELRGDDAVKGVIDGVEMTERGLLQTLEKHGIRLIDPLGEKFDHNFHQALFEADASDKAPGTVIEVMQTGFAIHNRLLRPAMVGVAKGPAGDKEPGEGVDTVA